MTTNKTISTIILGTVFFFSCSHKIHEGLGFDNLQINKTTKKEITDKYGKRHTDNGQGYFTMDYNKKGIKFGFGTHSGFRINLKTITDTSKLKIISIATDRLNCFSDGGLNINKRTTVQDIYKKFGKPESRYGGGDSIYIHRYDDNSIDNIVTFFIDYPDKGIGFSVETDLSFIKKSELLDNSTLIKRSLDIDSIYFRQRVTEVSVYEKQK